MQNLKQLLRGLRLTDEDGSLSLTSVALLMVMVKTALTPTLSMEDVGLFMAAVAQYGGKKFLNQRAASSEAAETIASLGQDVQALKIQVTSLTNKNAQLETRTAALVSKVGR